MRHLRSVPAMRPPGSPRRGDLAGSNTSEPRGSAPRERDHRGGDHPVPSRTRQLSPPSPRVLQREAAGGQGVALAEGAFLYAPREARGGTAPCGPLRALGEVAAPRAALRAPPRDGRRSAAGPSDDPACVWQRFSRHFGCPVPTIWQKNRRCLRFLPSRASRPCPSSCSCR